MHEGSDRAVPILAQLLTGIINDAKTLVRHELALATYEIREELRKTKAAMLSLGIGIGVGAPWRAAADPHAGPSA